MPFVFGSGVITPGSLLDLGKHSILLLDQCISFLNPQRYITREFTDIPVNVIQSADYITGNARLCSTQ